MPIQQIIGQYNKIKIKLTADIIINDWVFQDQQMQLNFICLGENYKYISKEYITKYIPDDNIECGKNYELSIEKEIDVTDLNKFTVHICVTTNEENEHWRADKKITVSNIKALILSDK
jgi:hypothetical protein